MSRIVENALLVYTDGSLYPRGRKGGFGIVFVHVDEIGNEVVLDTHAPPGIIGTTNNRMELQAAVVGLEKASEFDCFLTVNRVVVRTDSRYVADHYMLAMGNWRAAGWRNQTGRPIENVDLWKDFTRAFRALRKRVEVEWVKGHAKDIHNKAADKLAAASAKSPLSRRVYRSSVRRKTSTLKTKRGSVEMQGQQMVVRIIEVERMRAQKVWKYRYEVLSTESPFCGCVDLIFSREQLRDGHKYEVRVNDATANPEIVELLREVDPKPADDPSGRS